jgi:hypothetical protein
MRRALGLAFAFSLFLVSAASADIPLPKDIKYVDPRVKFEGVEKYSDYVFYLRFLTFTGGPANTPYTLIEVKDDKVFNLNAQRRLLNMNLLAMERKEFEKRAKEAPPSKWLTDKTEGILKATVPIPATTAPVTLKEAPVTTYSVTLTDGKLKAEMVETKKSSAAPVDPSSAWILGIVASFSLAWFGLWFVRRGRNQNAV